MCFIKTKTTLKEVNSPAFPPIFRPKSFSASSWTKTNPKKKNDTDNFQRTKSITLSSLEGDSNPFYIQRSKTNPNPEPPQKKKPVAQRPVRRHAYSDEMNDLKIQRIVKDDEYTKILKKCSVDVNILYNSDVEAKDTYLEELIEV